MTDNELQAKLTAAEEKLAKIYATEPVGWWHRGDTLDESDFFEAESGAGIHCETCQPLIPKPQEAV